MGLKTQKMCTHINYILLFCQFDVHFVVVASNKGRSSGRSHYCFALYQRRAWVGGGVGGSVAYLNI